MLLAGLTLTPAPIPAMAQEPDAAFAACLEFSRLACDDALRADPENLTAQFMRGLAAELDADNAAALADFDAVATREPRHFGAQLWRHVAAVALNRADDQRFQAYLDQSGLPDWPRGLGLLYLGGLDGERLLALAAAQPVAARAEALCAAHYHIGRAAQIAGDGVAAMAHFRAALATGATRVFEYRAARQVLEKTP